MIGVDEARERILSHFRPLEAVDIPLLEALGLVAAADVVASAAVPPFRNSAMDGYALRAADAARAPVTLRVVDNVAAGTVSPLAVAAGEAMRIMTGAPLPAGADAVVRFEETNEVDDPAPARQRRVVEVRRAPRTGDNVREAGEDIAAGDVPIQAGTRLGPAAIGLLASLNLSSARVHRRPVVGILATGDEVAEVGAELGPGQIRNSNSYMLAALVRRYDGDPVLLGVARDSAADLRDALRHAGNADLLVTSGGVSVGDFDLVKDFMQSEGRVDVWQVRMKPGKPLAFGVIGSLPVLGLPGNPVAALVSFEQFGRPALLKMLGRTDLAMPTVRATLSEKLENRGGRRHFVRGVLTRDDAGFRVHPTGERGSAVLTSAARSNCLIVVPETADVVESGSVIDVQVPDPETLFTTLA
ncbi:MAG TPA: gephyrin-like molybdotransferase Glp [Thermomicrobiales bacterium]|nr:gephyrin-like molybdotransferase Glp [Thermomicrobiales bacterium]